MKTSEDILTEIYKFVKGSTLEKAVKGTVYKDGDRPTDATTEDITVGVIASTIGQIQTATIDVIIFVPDMHRGNDIIEDRTRVKELMRTALDLFKPQGIDDWRIQLESDGQSVETTPDYQHFHCIVNRLYYQHCSI